jgi:hypothetical protein
LVVETFMHRGLLICVALVGAASVAAFAGYRFVFPPSSPPATEPGAVAADETMKVLDEAERTYLWDIEHHGNLLNKHGFAVLTRALSNNNRSALEACLAANLTASEPDRPTEVKLQTDVLDVHRASDAGKPPRALSRERLLEQLLEWRRIFSATPKAKLSLMTLSPVKRTEPDGPWQGTGQLRLWGKWAPEMPAEVVVYLHYRIPKPTEERLAEGHWLEACDITQVQVGKARRFLLRDVTRERGIKTSPEELYDNWAEDTALTSTGGVYACDFNRDGWTDLLVTDLKGTYLYQGRPGGKFEDVTAKMGLGNLPKPAKNEVLRAAFVDLDNDGWEDLILGDTVYRNDGGQRFVSMTGKTNLWLPPDYSAIVAADFDRDGLVDIYVTRPGPPLAGSWLTGKSGDTQGNYLLRNKGGWMFEDVTRIAGVGGDQRSTFTAAWLDADNDGWPDLYIINEFGEGVLYHNKGKGTDGNVTFEPRPVAKGPCDFGAMGLTVGDIDNDGNIDIYSGNMYSKAGKRVMGNLRSDAYPPDVMARMRTFVTGSQLHRNLGNFRFEQLGQAWQVNDCGWAYGPALVDLDNDGFLDLYATCGFISRSRTEPDG